MTEVSTPTLPTEKDAAQNEHWHPAEFVPASEITPRYKALLAASSKTLLEKTQYQELAEQNPVSGLPNRRVFDQSLDELIEAAEQGGSTDIGVAFVDLDGFKSVNDTFGHSKGDEVLRSTGKYLQRVVRDDDLVVHFGGDEFAVLMPNLFRPDSSEQAVDKPKLIENLRTRFHEAAEAAARDSGAGSSASVGISIYQPGDTVESLTNRADEEMYKDKVLGDQGRPVPSRA